MSDILGNHRKTAERRQNDDRGVQASPTLPALPFTLPNKRPLHPPGTSRNVQERPPGAEETDWVCTGRASSK